MFLNGQPAFGASTTRGFTLIQPTKYEIPGGFTKDQAVDFANKLNCTCGPTKTKSIDAIVPPLEMTSLLQENLDHGTKQIREMIKDRPEMGLFVKEGDTIWNWTVRQFAGESTKCKIFWSPDELLQEKPPEYVSFVNMDSPEGPGSIMIRRYNKSGVPIDGERLWSACVFELLNAKYFGLNQHKIHDDVYKMSLSKAEYIERITRCEYQARLETAAFYSKYWRPYAETNSLTATDWYWRPNTPATYEEWMKQFTDPNAYPFDDYGNYYDRNISPYLKRLNKSS